MSHFVFWAIGFGVFWFGLRLDDEILLIVSVLVGAGLIFLGLLSAPLPLQLLIEAGCIMAVFLVCMRCIERGTKS